MSKILEEDNMNCYEDLEENADGDNDWFLN